MRRCIEGYQNRLLAVPFVPVVQRDKASQTSPRGMVCPTEELTMRQILLAFIVVLLVASASIACPVGSFEWLDRWGNRICKTFDTGQTKSIEGNTQSCPTGTHPWVDKWGNPICKSFQGGQQYYDTSKGCPIGTYQWIDNWGNQICKKL